MTDYKEEQKNELEALESIYPSEFSILETEPDCSFSIQIKTDDYEEGSEDGGLCNLCFTYVPTYPDEVPLIEVTVENLEDDDVNALHDMLVQLAQENLGMVMIFTLVSAAQEWLTSHLENIKEREAEEKERILKEKEEAERKRLEGTRVTVESFISWKLKFDADMQELKKKQLKDETGAKKLTGRELFEKDVTLNESDIRFYQEGEEEVKVDESLFEDLDALDIDEDLGEVSDDQDD